jgi:hypothetical protein
MWPFLIKDLILKPQHIAKDELMILVGIEHGPKAPVDMNPLLLLLGEDLATMWVGIVGDGPVTPTAKCDLIKAAVLMLQADYPGFSKLLKMQDAGSLMACMDC